MSSVGYYRLKASYNQDTDVFVYINGEPTESKTVKVTECCDLDRRIKFINKDGQYRFLNFNRFWEGKDKAKELGKANKFVTSLLTSQTSQDSIGNKNERILNLRSDHVSAEELEIIKDMWTSPRIYLYVGDGTTDLQSDWIQVTITPKNSITNIRKGSFTDIIIDVTLPEHYTINMI